jgi:DNA-binding NarL/FixJ family response regulator
MRIKLLVDVQDEDVRQNLRAWFDQPACADIECRLARAGDLSRELDDFRPDVVLSDDQLHGEKALLLAGGPARVGSRPRVLLLCETQTHDSIISFLQQGVCGCLHPTSAPSLVAKAVRAVDAGENWLERSAMMRALQSSIAISDAASEKLPEGVLTQRELEILHLIGAALTNKEIARHLAISDKTVKTHLHHIYVKLNRSGRYKALLSRDPILAPAVRRMPVEAAAVRGLRASASSEKD